jgi:hypothetical protein
LFVAAGVFVAAFAAARGLPPDRRTANGGPNPLEWQEMHTPRVLRSAALMKVLRAAGGFVFFHLAFWLNDQDAGKIWFGLCVSVGALCILAANSVAPLLRQRVNVDLMLAGTVVGVALAGLWAGWRGSILSGIVLTGVVNAAGAFGRLAFEATVQRDAPDANRARVLARFETHNQLVWAFAGVVPVLLSLSGQVGFSAVGLIGAAGCILFVTMSPGRFSRD